jgi:hypothetical protein
MEKIIQSSPSPRCLPVPTWQITRTSHREGVSVSHGAAGSNPGVLISPKGDYKYFFPKNIIFKKNFVKIMRFFLLSFPI